MSEIHIANETLRKSLHIAFGCFAFSLRWLPWTVAAGVAAAAVLGNWLVLHRIVGKGVARHERGFDTGIVLYPLVVLALIVVFRHNLVTAAVVWAILAFGDGFATVIGKGLRIAALPWNPVKSWGGFIAFQVFGTAGAWAAALFVWQPDSHLPVYPLWIVATATLAAALVESADTGIDDNLTVPVAAGVTMFLLSLGNPELLFRREHVIWLAINTVLAILGYVARSVNLSGMLGGWILGAILIVCGQWALYLALLAFFVIGTGSTKLGYQRKAKEGLAQEGGGRRGFGHAFANVGVAAICAVAMAFLRPHWEATNVFGSLSGWSVMALLWVAAIASLATAGGDTVGSEIGQLLGRRTFLPLSLRPVPRGTEGAISLEGTLAGIVAAAMIAMAGVGGIYVTLERAYGPQGSAGAWWRLVALVTACAVVGSYAESLIGDWNRRHGGALANGVINFANTFIGAGLVIAIAPFLWPWLPF